MLRESNAVFHTAFLYAKLVELYWDRRPRNMENQEVMTMLFSVLFASEDLVDECNVWTLVGRVYGDSVKTEFTLNIGGVFDPTT